jgi:hypothetical protein
MTEHETGPKRKPDSEQKGPPKRERPVRGEKKGKKSEQAASLEKRTVYEAGTGAQEADPKFEKREELLREACEQAKQSGNVQERDINMLITLLKKKDQEQLTDKEKAGLWKLLFLLLKLIWKEVVKLFKEQEYAELMAAAKTAGAKSDAEMLLWMIGETGIKASDLKELEDVFKGKALDERQKTGERSPEEEERRLEHLGRGGDQGGKGELSEEELEEIAKMEPGALHAAARNTKEQFEDYKTLIPRIAERNTAIGPEILEHKSAMQGLLGELSRLESIPESERDIEKITDLERHLETEFRTIKGLWYGLGKEERSNFMNFYGPWAVALMKMIEEYREDGVFRIIANRPEKIAVQDIQEVAAKLGSRSKKVLAKDQRLSDSLKMQSTSLETWVAELGQVDQYAAMSEDDRKTKVVDLKERVRRDIVKPLIEKIIGDAEDDPREGFRMRPGGDILFSELMDAIRNAGPTGRFDKQLYENEFMARRVVQFIQSEMIKRADPERIGDPRVGGNLFSEDLDTLMRLEPGLGPARRIIERVLAQAPLNPDPKQHGRIPNTYLNPALRAEYEPPIAEKLVAEQLMQLSDRGFLFDRDGNSFRMEEEEADRMAALAMKMSNLELRTAEHLSMTKLPPKKHGEAIKSSPQDKMRFDHLRFIGERFERYGQGREAFWPMIRRINQFVQPGVFEKIPDEVFDQWGVNPENILKIGGIDSASTWRILTATKDVRELGLALGVQLYEEGAKKTLIWGKVGERLPTVISRYFPTLALKGVVSQETYYKLSEELSTQERQAFLVGDQYLYFDLDKRLREGLIQHKKEFIESVERKVQEKIDDEVFKEIRGELLEDIESKLFPFKGGKEAAAGALGGIQNIKGLNEAISKASTPDLRRKLEMLRDELKERLADRRKELKLQIGAQTAFLGVVAEAHEIPFQGEWETKAWEMWEGLQKKLTILEEKALQEYAIDARKAKKEGRELPPHPSIMQMARDADFSDQDMKIVERLSFLGGKNEGERAEGAARMANVEFSFIAFTEDILHEDARWQELGSADILRRYGDTQMAASGAELMWKIAGGLSGQQDKVIATRQELLKSLIEFQETLGYLSLGDRQKVTATLTHEIINNLFKADAWWLNIPLVGPMLDMEWPWGSMLASSRAQKKFGLKALSMTALERWRFIEDMRPFIGNQYSDKLQLMLKARRRDVVKQLALQWGLPAGAYLGWAWFLGPALKQLQGYMSDIGG